MEVCLNYLCLLIMIRHWFSFIFEILKYALKHDTKFNLLHQNHQLVNESKSIY